MTIRRIVASLAANGNCFEALEESGLQWFLYSEGNGGDFMILQTAVTLGFLKTVGILVLFGAFFFYLFRMAARIRDPGGEEGEFVECFRKHWSIFLDFRGMLDRWRRFSVFGRIFIVCDCFLIDMAWVLYYDGGNKTCGSFGGLAD